MSKTSARTAPIDRAQFMTYAHSLRRRRVFDSWSECLPYDGASPRIVATLPRANHKPRGEGRLNFSQTVKSREPMSIALERPNISPAVDEWIVADRMLRAAFDCAIYDRLAPFQRRALEKALDADDDGEMNALAESVRAHFQSACAAMAGAFKREADLAFNAAADAAALEIKAVIGDDEDNVVPFRLAKED